MSVLVYQNTDRKPQDVKTLQCDEHHRDFPAEKTRHHRICYGFTGYNRTCIGFNGNCNCPYRSPSIGGLLKPINPNGTHYRKLFFNG